MAVSLRDIAKRAKVSFPAVSSVVNNSRSTVVVSDKTRRRIERIAKELGYVPNAGARAIRRGSFNRIALIVTRHLKEGGEAGWTALPSYLDTAVSILADQGYSLVFEPFDLDLKTQDFLAPPRLFSELNFDGILAVDTAGLVHTHVDEFITGMKSPVVWINRNPGPGYSTVIADEVDGARRLTRHLLDLEHRHIGYIGVDTDHYAPVKRAQGVRDELRSAGLDTRGILLMPHHGRIRDQVEAVLNFVPRITGLICYNYVWYDVALHLAARRGLRVPQDLSLCCFACPWELDFQLFTTGLKVPEIEMTQTAVGILMDLIKNKQNDPVVRSIPGQLVIGETTAQCREGEDQNG
jgi:LacI family transcriptional regulator